MAINPALFAVGGVLIGAIGGYIIHDQTTRPVEVVRTEIEEVKRELTDEELENLCSEPIQEGRNDLQAAQAQVASLEDQLASKKAELADMQRQAALDEAARVEGAKAWQAMEAEIARLESELEQAVAERDELKEELRVTIFKLDQQILETEKAQKERDYFKNESTVNLWAAFMAGAKVDICDRGSRKRHAKCHDAVEIALGRAVRDRFVDCVNTYQATPLLVQAEKDAELPPH